MPQLRSRPAAPVQSPYFKNNSKKKPQSGKKQQQTFTAKDSDVDTMTVYPVTKEERAAYVNPKTNRAVTPFYFKVYDLCAQIPKGHVSTYKAISDALGSHPRAVGQALRNNPFCPLPIPCHRVIASDLTIGGFSGSIGDSQFVADKKAKLAKEGCLFDEFYKFEKNVDGTKEIFTRFMIDGNGWR